MLSATAVGGLAGRGIAPALLPEIGHRLATGDLSLAASLAGETGRSVLMQGYGDAFRSLTHGLAAITILSALSAFTLLGQRKAAEAARESDAMPDAVSDCR
jgi:hypothetical protein